MGTDSYNSFESSTRKSGYNSPEASLVMKSFQYAIPKEVSNNPMILSAIPSWICFEWEGSMGRFRYKLETGLDDLVETIRQEALTTILIERQPLAQMRIQDAKTFFTTGLIQWMCRTYQDLQKSNSSSSKENWRHIFHYIQPIFEHLHKPCKVRAKLGVKKSIIMWVCLQERQAALKFTKDRFSSHSVMQTVLNEHMCHRAVTQDEMNTHLASVKKEQEELMKELRSLAGRKEETKEVTPESSPGSDHQQENKTNNTYKFDLPNCALEDPPWTKIGCSTSDLPPIEVILLQGEWGTMEKPMWEWSGSDRVIKITGAQGKLSRGKKQNWANIPHNSMLPPSWKTGSIHLLHTKLEGITYGWFIVEWTNRLGEKSINFTLPPVIQTTRHQLLSSRAHNNIFLPEPKPKPTLQKDGYNGQERGSVYPSAPAPGQDLGNFDNYQSFLGPFGSLATTKPAGEEQQNKILSAALVTSRMHTFTTPSLYQGVLELDLETSFNEETLRNKDKDRADVVTDKTTKSDDATVPKSLWNEKIAEALMLEWKADR
eukprot:jgi/Psemu1/38293/gm1.38293_g